MKISHKLFFAFIGLTTIILIATLSLARWSFEQGFLNYINALEQERLHAIAVEQTKLYQNNQHDWHQISRRDLLDTFRYTPANYKNALPPNVHATPPPLRSQSQSPSEKPLGPKRPPPHLKPKGGMPPAPKTGLYSIDNKWIGGNRISNLGSATHFAIMLDGKVIGRLYSPAIRQVNSDSATEFANQQLFANLWIGCLCLLLAGAISFILARLLLVPVEKVLQGISHLSRGNYEKRFSHYRKDELGQLMRDIDLLAVTLEKNRSARNRWFADISHELRTPLAILCGEIDAIKAGIRPFDQQQLLSLEQEILRLKLLVDDLFQLSLADLGGLKYQFEPLDLQACIAESMTSLTQKFAEKGLECQLNQAEAVWVSGDKRRMQQLITNILLNSAAYTDAPGKVVVDILVEGKHAVICINDTKPTVNSADCDLLFEPLFRLDSSRSRRVNGAGLGLTICKNIAEAHSASIKARPSNIGGLCIEVVIPLLKK
ncbi:ATP-binding protein [Shewanella youngdeokensis]|uniref:histidine kinase n=1 Tax=Shewanella youngdeokensis TaxID=2999068 RepID=A0ABZ0JX34_9GAMM|nr:ATP-binding protein [Shewanella sp. DAU334]